MSIHHKVNNQLIEFASKVSFDDASRKLTINGTDHKIFDRSPLFTTTFVNTQLSSNNNFILSDLILWSRVPPQITIVCMFFYWGDVSTTWRPRIDLALGESSSEITFTKFHHGTGEVSFGANNDRYYHQLFQVSGLNNGSNGNINQLFLKIDNKTPEIFTTLSIYEGHIDEPDFVEDNT